MESLINNNQQLQDTCLAGDSLNVSAIRIDPPNLTTQHGPGLQMRNSTVIGKLYAIFNPQDTLEARSSVNSSETGKTPLPKKSTKEEFVHTKKMAILIGNSQYAKLGG